MLKSILAPPAGSRSRGNGSFAQLPIGGAGRSFRGSWITGQSVWGVGKKFARAPSKPPAEQIVWAFAMALFWPIMPRALEEFEKSAQSLAVTWAFYWSAKAAGAPLSRVSMQSRICPTTLARALTAMVAFGRPT